MKTAAETLRAEPEAQHREGDHRARRRRGAGVAPRREGHARGSSSARSSCRRPRKIGPVAPEEREEADRVLGDRRPLREGGRPRVGVREAQGADRVEAGRGAAGQGRRPGSAAPAPAEPGRGRHADRHPVRLDRPARRAARGHRRGHGEEHGAAGRAARSCAACSARSSAAASGASPTANVDVFLLPRGGDRARRRRRDRVLLPADPHQARLRLRPRPGHAALAAHGASRCRSSWPRRSGSGATGRRSPGATGGPSSSSASSATTSRASSISSACSTSRPASGG